MTQEAAVQALGWSQSTLSRLEAGETPYDQDKLEQLAELYRCDVVDLIRTDPTDPQAEWAALVRIAKAPPAIKGQILSYARFELSSSGKGD